MNTLYWILMYLYGVLLTFWFIAGFVRRRRAKYAEFSGAQIAVFSAMIAVLFPLFWLAVAAVGVFPAVGKWIDTK